MRKRTRLVIGALSVTLALGAAVGASSARRFALSEQHFLILFNPITFEEAGHAAANRVVCSMNIEGSFHSRTISKVSGQLIGFVTEARFIHPCTTNNAFVLNGTESLEGRTVATTLPWHIVYLKFFGALPNIVGIEIQFNNAGILEKLGTLACLYEATPARGFRGLLDVQNGVVTFFEEAGIMEMEKIAGSILCPAATFWSGNGAVGNQAEWRSITVRLVA